VGSERLSRFPSPRSFQVDICGLGRICAKVDRPHCVTSIALSRGQLRARLLEFPVHSVILSPFTFVCLFVCLFVCWNEP